MKRMPLTHGEYALVDDEDYEWLSEYSWHVLKRRNTFYAVGYVMENGRPKNRRMHRMIIKAEEGQQVDHINHNGLDNRKENLRICTNNQNQMNSKKRPGMTSKYKGVSWHKQKKRWCSEIKINRNNIHLGSFKDEKKAAMVYDDAARKYFGEFAYLNF